jgi:hypothetical protein
MHATMPETMRTIGSTTMRVMAHVASANDEDEGLHLLPEPHVYPFGQQLLLLSQRKYPAEHVAQNPEKLPVPQ